MRRLAEFGHRCAAIAAAMPPAVWGIAGVSCVAYIARPEFLSVPFLLLLVRQAAPLGIVALGQTFVVINRSLDLSVGAVIALVNIIISDRFWIGVPLVWIVLAALATGLAVGIVNGLLVTRLRASAVVITLGMASILVGLGYIISDGAPGNAMHETIKWLGRGRIGSAPVSGFVWLLLALAAAFVLRKIVVGTFIHAAGDNPSAARFSGIRTDRVLLFSHAVSGLLAATGGLILSGLIGVGALNLGTDYVLSSIAAVILGGAVFGGAAGSAWGTVLGTALLVMMLNLMTVFGFDEPGKLIVQGMIIAVAAGLYRRTRRESA